MQQEPVISESKKNIHVSSGLNWLIKVSTGLLQTADGLSDHCVLTGSVDVTDGTDQTLRFAVRQENCFYGDEKMSLHVRQDIYTVVITGTHVRSDVKRTASDWCSFVDLKVDHRAGLCGRLIAPFPTFSAHYDIIYDVQTLQL